MPLEIRELHIKVTVNQPKTESEGAQNNEAAASEEKTDQQVLIQHCVEQVLDIMNTKKER